MVGREWGMISKVRGFALCFEGRGECIVFGLNSFARERKFQRKWESRAVSRYGKGIQWGALKFELIDARERMYLTDSGIHLSSVCSAININPRKDRISRCDDLCVCMASIEFCGSIILPNFAACSWSSLPYLRSSSVYFLAICSSCRLTQIVDKQSDCRSRHDMQVGT